MSGENCVLEGKLRARGKIARVRGNCAREGKDGFHGKMVGIKTKGNAPVYFSTILFNDGGAAALKVTMPYRTWAIS